MKKGLLKILFLVALFSAACDSKEGATTTSRQEVKNDSVITTQKRSSMPVVSKSDVQNLAVSDSVKQLLQQADTLKKYYQLLVDNRNEAKYEELFFEAFPKDFKTLNAIYGNEYLEENIGGLPMETFFEHIGLFYALNHVNQETFYRKMISVSIEGKWEADGVNVFRHHLGEKVLAKPELTFDILQEKNNSQIISFFFFFFDGPHPPEEVPNEFKGLQDSHTRLYSLATKGLAKAKEPHLLN